MYLKIFILTSTAGGLFTQMLTIEAPPRMVGELDLAKPKTEGAAHEVSGEGGAVLRIA